ncbi:helix-turn-helix domain-containing protein [Cupriavidus basilensis]
MKPEPTEPSAESAKAFAPLKISSRQIALINALAEHRNLRRAAAAMHTTQPAASLLLQQLEERLGVQLFERLPRGMEPTLYGEVLIRFAQGSRTNSAMLKRKSRNWAAAPRAWCGSAPSWVRCRRS